MKIGIPRERKENEFRVALTPEAVRVVVNDGHDVFIEKNAGTGSGITDDLYIDAGATVVQTEAELFKKSKLIVKVKEPQKEEYDLITSSHILFCYLHLAAEKKLTDTLIKSGVKAIAFETVQLEDGTLPLLAPMSRIAGRLSIQIGIHLLEKYSGGKGILMSGVPGVKPARVLIVGGGTVGFNAASIACGLGATVSVIDKDPKRLSYFFDYFRNRVYTLPSYPEIIENECMNTDLVVGSVLIAGKSAPRVITKRMMGRMEPGTVFVDVAIDQGGCSETSKPTTHKSPTYMVNDVIHYCVTNIPSLVSRTASFYLSNEIMPYLLRIANGELDDTAISRGINVDSGKLNIKF